MDEETKNMVRDMYTVILGVPGTDNRGMAGDCQDMKDHLAQLNGDVKTNTTWRKAFCWALGLISGGFGVFAAWTIVG